MMHIETIQEFYRAMQDSVPARRRAVDSILRGAPAASQGIELLDGLCRALEGLRGAEGTVELGTGGLVSGRKTLSVDVSYEVSELRKDLIFLEKGEEALMAHMVELHPGFREQLSGGLEFFRSTADTPECLISDRDGTVNNYCGRYLSSVQSAYNAVFLCRFAATLRRGAVILTSAPLTDRGLEQLTVSPPGRFVLAGSKGREYLAPSGRRGAFPIDKDKQKRLDRLNGRLGRLLKQPRYEIFGLIGSGLQFKFGQTTVARQDIHGSIPEAESLGFRSLIRELVGDVDPRGTYFRIEDTGKDIEIILTVDGRGGTRDFDKGDGILFLDDELGLELKQGGNLICGDTASDIPMVAAAIDRSPATAAVFVSRDEQLQRRVRAACGQAHFLSEPDLLVCLLNQLAKEREND
jgi:hypothetical protein